MPRPLKILISAYACEPNKGSEPGVGWQWALQMARFHEIWVLTRANNRASIEAVTLSPEQTSRIHWVYFDLPRWASFWKRGVRGVQFYYYLWQLFAWWRAARLHTQVGFDIIHHATIGKYWVPSFLTFLPVKSILGPLGGGESMPPAMASTIGKRGRVFEFARNLVRTVARFAIPSRLAMRRASLVLATSDESRICIENLGASRVLVEPQLAMDDEQIKFFSGIDTCRSKPFRVISIGRLLHWKGFHLGLMAFARFQKRCPESEYWIVSSGPEAENWKALAKKLGIADRVTFWGHLPTLADVYEKLGQSHILVHPALHEAFGNVCLEALAAGRPVICLDTGGPALQVTPECGFKAPVSSVEVAVESMATAMESLYKDPQLLERMSTAARERVKNHFRWSEKAARMNALYHEVSGRA